ncbi:hypothetical protein GCM10017706_30090 [Lactococcus lactis subsp. hordniae]
MDWNQSASQIIHLIGGKENIDHLEHCSTRLRFTLSDDGKVSKEALEHVPGAEV